VKFELSEIERQRAFAFISKHLHNGHGGNIYYKFYPGAIGVAIHIGCCICKKFKDVTDFDSW